MEKRLSKQKYILATLVVVVLAVVAIVIGVAVSCEPAPSDEYFVSDETKLVISLNKDAAALEEGAYEPRVTHIVYYRSGERITGMRVYFAYDSAEEAEVAYNNINMKDKDWTTEKRLNGRYIVFEALKSQYDGVTVEDIQRNIEILRATGGLAQ